MTKKVLKWFFSGAFITFIGLVYWFGTYVGTVNTKLEKNETGICEIKTEFNTFRDDVKKEFAESRKDVSEFTTVQAEMMNDLKWIKSYFEWNNQVANNE